MVGVGLDKGELMVRVDVTVEDCKYKIWYDVRKETQRVRGERDGYIYEGMRNTASGWVGGWADGWIGGWWMGYVWL